MEKFTCLLPRGVTYGAGEIETIREKVAGRSVLLLSDKGVVGAGIAGRVSGICSSAAYAYNELMEVPAGPREDEVTAVVASLADMLNGGPQISDMFDGKVRVFANVGTPSTYETILLGREIVGLGVDGVAVITPYFIGCTQEGLFAHYSRIADSLDKPVFLKVQEGASPASATSCPRRSMPSARPLTPETWTSLWSD